MGYSNPRDDNGASSTESNIEGFIRAGQAYSITTGRIASSGTAGFVPLSIFNPSLSKNIKVYSITVYLMANGQILLNSVTSDPGPGWSGSSQLTPVNRKIGGPASAGVSTYTSTAAAGVSTTGTALASFGVSTGVEIELLTTGALLLPAGASSGLVVYLAVPGTSVYYGINIAHIEI